MKNVRSSFSDLFENNPNLHIQAKKTLYQGSSLIFSISDSLNKILKSSHGRDKICGIIQYWAEFYSACIKYSNIESVRMSHLNDLIISAIIASRLKHSLSQARKIFRFMKFFGELKQIKSIVNSKKTLVFKLLLSFSHTFSFLYYILDNALWLMNVGIFRDFISSKIVSETKNKKNIFSLMKVSIQLFLSSLFFYLRKKKENKMVNLLKLLNNDQNITIDSEAYDVCRAILRQRQKKRFEKVDVFLSFMRIIMLAKSLKFAKINPIFVAVFGIVSSSISLVKMLAKDEEQSNFEDIEVCEHEKDTEADNTTYETKLYRKRRLKSSALLMSTSVRINHSQSTCDKLGFN